MIEAPSVLNLLHDLRLTTVTLYLATNKYKKINSKKQDIGLFLKSFRESQSFATHVSQLIKIIIFCMMISF